MIRIRSIGKLFLAIIFLSTFATACGWLQLSPEQEPAWTPSPRPVATRPVGQAILPTVPPTKAVRATPVPLTTAAPLPTASAMTTSRPVATPEDPGPDTVIVTDADVAAVIESGVLAENGVDAENLRVRFTGGRIRVTADRVSYGLVQVDNLVLVGRLVAEDGVLQMETESVSPGGLVTAMIPTLVNQALRQYTSQWYVEDVEISEGQMELTVR